MAWWSEYEGIPFVWRGEGRAGADCAGLVRMVQREQFGRGMDVMQPVPLCDAQAGDVVQIRSILGGRVTSHHMGVVTMPGHILHAVEGVGAIHQKIDARLRGRVIGVYRLA